MMVNIPFYIILFFYIGFTTSTCNFNVKVTQILLNEGFHRNISYEIVFNSGDNVETQLYENCVVGLDQVLPVGVYANPDELSDLRRSHKINAILKNRVNIELPAEDSHPISVYIIGKVKDNKADLWLPVHARYHQAMPGGNNIRNEIEAPKLYLRLPEQHQDVCEKGISSTIQHLCKGSSKKNSSWKEISYSMMTDTLIWAVPVGNTDHYYMVATGTASVIVIGSLYLMKALHEYKIADMKKRF